MAISPAVMFSSPAIMRSSVDLPQPEGPTSTTNSPSAMSTLTPCSTSTEPNALRTLRMSTVAIGGPHFRRARTHAEAMRYWHDVSRRASLRRPASSRIGAISRTSIELDGKRAAVGTCSAVPALQHSTTTGWATPRYRRSDGRDWRRTLQGSPARGRSLWKRLGPLQHADGPVVALSASGRKALCRRFQPA